MARGLARRNRNNRSVEGRLLVTRIERIESSSCSVSFAAHSMDRLFVTQIRAIPSSSSLPSSVKGESKDEEGHVEEIFLEAMLLPNNIAVLRIPSHEESPLSHFKEEDIESFAFAADMDCESVSGKKKKNAFFIQEGLKIGQISLKNRHKVLSFGSPIAGKLLEMNQKLLSSPGLLASHASTLGYVAVLQYEGSARKNKKFLMGAKEGRDGEEMGEEMHDGQQKEDDEGQRKRSRQGEEEEVIQE